MTEGINRQWLLTARPAGPLTGREFTLNEAAIPQPADGQVLVRNLWLSFDPTQRGWMARDTYVPMIPLGEPMRAAAPAKWRATVVFPSPGAAETISSVRTS